MEINILSEMNPVVKAEIRWLAEEIMVKITRVQKLCREIREIRENELNAEWTAAAVTKNLIK